MIRPVVLFLAMTFLVVAADYRTPAGTRTTSTKLPGAVLPGGRLLSPPGRLVHTGPGVFGMAVSPSGNRVVTADGGPNRFSLTVLDRGASGEWATHTLRAKRRGDGEADDENEWRSVFMGLAFESESILYASEGNNGAVRVVEVPSGKLLHRYSLNRDGFKDSYTGDLALDRERGILYVLDQANFCVAAFDTRNRQLLSRLRVGRLPFAVALSPDRQRLYVTHIGMFEYKAIPGADPKNLRETALEFPAFGFPSKESAGGVTRPNAKGEAVRVDPLGDPNVLEANSLAAIDVSEARRPKLLRYIRTGVPFGQGVHGGSGPAGVIAAGDSIWVTNSNQDSITEVDAAALKVRRTIPLRIDGLESLRGILPVGLAHLPERNWLLVAEAGINATGVIDLQQGKLIGHIPAPWFPTRVAVHGGKLLAAAAKGSGTGPNARLERSFQGELRRGAFQETELPEAAALTALTDRVYANNGFRPAYEEPPPLPKAIRHVVVIVKENRTHDEVFGDIAGDAELARLGAKVTPNHHEIARRWAISANFYADSEVSVDGHHWLVGSYPNAWTESTLMAAYGGQKDFRLPTSAPGRLLFAGSNSSVHPEEQLEAGTLWHHLERHRIPFRNFGEGFELSGVDEGAGLKPTGGRYPVNVPMPDPLYRNTSRQYPNYNMNIPDQFRASQLIGEWKGMKELPRFIYVHLPNDHMARARPADGYPKSESFVADNDYALGRILEYLSRRPEWKQMAVLITEDDAQGGVDSVDSHRTVLMVASPFARRGHVSRQHSSFPGLLKTAFRLLGIPPLNLYDAAATDLSDCFLAPGEAPDFAPYDLKPVDPALFDPAKARDPKDPRAPSEAMDDPAVLREQHRQRQRR